MLALLPVTAAVVGFLALRQVPHAAEFAGIVAVAAAVGVQARGVHDEGPPNPG